MTEQNDSVVILSAKRTPMGSFQGLLSSIPSPKLSALVNEALIKEVGISLALLDEIILGCVLSAGLGQAPARQAGLFANIPPTVGATTINKMCGSGMKAVMMAHDLIQARSAQFILAGGTESMSNAPYLLSKARGGYRLGHGELQDHLFLDGLEDVYNPGQLMGRFAEKTASYFGFSREAQDDFAIASMTKALAAQKTQAFSDEIVPISVIQGRDHITVSVDESPAQSKLEKVKKLRPVFDPEGTVTAANSSSISDGAASVLLTTENLAYEHGLKPIAKIAAHATHAQEPEWFTTAPIEAIKKVIKKAGWKSEDVDLYEINEAFAVVTMAAIKSLSLDEKCVNINGGACALGHPIGASGARILVTLIHALKKQGKKRGIASLCIGGGEATAIAIELL